MKNIDLKKTNPMKRNMSFVEFDTMCFEYKKWIDLPEGSDISVEKWLSVLKGGLVLMMMKKDLKLKDNEMRKMIKSGVISKTLNKVGL